ncbi:UDP-N-acetylmuramoyl-L-alanyl-D-glutamate--2,6-diaminopimelate ligase [Sphingomonas abietis]|uniref:UDP-N-acetylmuramoyl-L-alanyl-D-glutamate--2,6-diaminopimelate ligase n=1 Tax=Sphingomonas abietis TaxID=3012344 RepID=A0ABY7NSF7_9SPHN|nr:UDP-N-acetylmuramoyl-L-alanyl-D-glutamate--2,6-diaminopimelate ligase [Sphingomonas abietis]WBO23386.1 UDP-N-acetylmuramoyl-L-alanyl-D-glutamate--2,6-diaminopimelate ligase [Sphingomonas abietis]
MKLGALIGESAGEAAGATVTGCAIDHRKVAPGTVFGAFMGWARNGEDFIDGAVAAGAIAIVARPEANVPAGVVHIADAEPRRAFARIAAKFYAPFPKTVVAVTGTNGKTSTVEMVRQLWHMQGLRAASIGTLGVTTTDGEGRAQQVSTGLTTPDIVTFLSNMAGLRREGVTHAAFEASSHGLAQFRTEGLPVKVVAFTNLSRDHLDYHGTMEAYLEAKLRLFSEVVDRDGAAVVWADDAASSRVIEIARERGLKLITVGGRGETLKLIERTPTQLGQTLTIEAGQDFGGKVHKVNLPLIGAYQAANALVAAGFALATGVSLADVLGGLSRLQPVRGRLERAVITAKGAPVYVDYAHTPDGLQAAIEALKPHAQERLIVVFGAGGDRDAGKRPEMGAIAAKLADIAIVTDDNPRTEDPATIRAAIMAAAPGATEIGDRRAAIAAAIAQAGEGDVVLVAGKGHEIGQIVGDMLLPFDDVQVAREVAA